MLVPLILLTALGCGPDKPGADGTAGTVDCPTPSTWYVDADRDGYGAGAPTGQGCVRPDGHVANDRDCDDHSDAVNPAAEELCDGVDNDCDGLTDPGSAADAVDCWRDADDDGYGDPEAREPACACEQGWVADDSDCDDTSAAASPSGVEVCNGRDDDCDDLTDEGLSGTWYLDSDGDGYGDALTEVEGCPGIDGDWVDLGDDCDEADPGINPGAHDLCDDDVDQDCDLRVDECGFDAVTLPGDAWWTAYRDPETSNWGLIGRSMVAAGDSNGNGKQEILAPILVDRCDPLCAVDYQYALLEAPAHTSGGARAVEMDTIASWAVLDDEDRYWTATGALDDIAIAGVDLDGDGTGDYIMGGKGARLSDHSEFGVSRVDLWYGEPVFGSTLSDPTDLDTALTAQVSSDPYLNAVVSLLEPPQAGSDWVLAAGTYPDDDTLEGTAIPFVYLLDASHFNGSSSPDDAIRLWSTRPYLAGQSIETGDIDGDGIGDLLASSEQYTWGLPPGRIWGFHGRFDSDRTMDDADLVVDGVADDDFFGFSFTLVSDFSGDGLPELIIHQVEHCGESELCIRIFDIDDDCPDGACTAVDASATLASTSTVGTHNYYVPKLVPSISDATRYDLAVTVGTNADDGSYVQRVLFHDTPIEGVRPVSEARAEIRTDERDLESSGFGSEVMGGVD